MFTVISMTFEVEVSILLCTKVFSDQMHFLNKFRRLARGLSDALTFRSLLQGSVLVQSRPRGD